MTLGEMLLTALGTLLTGAIGVGIEMLRRKANSIVHEVTPNSGASMRDAVDRIEQAVAGLAARVTDLESATQRRRFFRRTGV